MLVYACILIKWKRRHIPNILLFTNVLETSQAWNLDRATNNSSFLPPVVCRRDHVHVLLTLFVLVYVICACLRIVVSSTYCVHVCCGFFVLCTPYCHLLLIFHFWLPLRYSLSCIYLPKRTTNHSLFVFWRWRLFSAFVNFEISFLQSKYKNKKYIFVKYI